MDDTQALKCGPQLSTGLRSFAGAYLLYVDVPRMAVRSTLDCLNVAAPRLDAPGRVHSTPIRSVATSPMIQRVTLLVELVAEPPDVLAINDTLWTVLYKSVNWSVNQIIIGPVAYYEQFVTERLFLFESADFTYTADKQLCGVTRRRGPH